MSELEMLADQAADLHASQQAMPDDGALEAHRDLIRAAYELGRQSATACVGCGKPSVIQLNGEYLCGGCHTDYWRQQ